MSECNKYVIMQLKAFFLLSDNEKTILESASLIEKAEEKAKYALAGFNGKYYKGIINPINSVMYCNFLYWLSHFCFLNGYTEIADKVYYLNKMLNSVDLFYEIELPEIWTCEHPLGAVMGRAKYSNNFLFYQGCTVGGNKTGGHIYYPVIGENVTMYSHSKILGKSIIGNNVIMAANSYVINEDVPDNCIVFGESPNLRIKLK